MAGSLSLPCHMCISSDHSHPHITHNSLTVISSPLIQGPSTLHIVIFSLENAAIMLWLCFHKWLLAISGHGGSAPMQPRCANESRAQSIIVNVIMTHCNRFAVQGQYDSGSLLPHAHTQRHTQTNDPRLSLLANMSHIYELITNNSKHAAGSIQRILMWAPNLGQICLLSLSWDGR